MYDTILVTLDGTTSDRAIIEHVKQLAKLAHSRLVLLHVADGWAADSPVIENMIGYSRVHPVLKTLRRQSSELHLPFTLISAVEQTNVFLTQSEDVKPLLAAEQGEQGPDLESF